MTTCGKCGRSSFTVQSGEPAGSQFVIYFVQCSSCGTPVGVLESNNLGAMISRLEQKVNAMVNEIRQIGYDVNEIQSNLRR